VSVIPYRRGTWDFDAFSRALTSLMLVNVSRGGLVDKDALLAAFSLG
jgi:lactate dehydrogenase-like 2-hydroxyacid dehydrogenase